MNLWKNQSLLLLGSVASLASIPFVELNVVKPKKKKRRNLKVTKNQMEIKILGKIKHHGENTDQAKIQWDKNPEQTKTWEKKHRKIKHRK
nr:variable surface lipoprotein [Mycoplasmopsis bovis]